MTTSVEYALVTRQVLRVMVTALFATLLAACSKTVRWEEEVLLNTGETIWVKRTVVYVPMGDAGNPLDIAYRPERIERIEFSWSHKEYRYEGDADLMLLAISPAKVPVLVGPAANKSWSGNHNYKCTTPYYVQLIPDASGRNWSWPPAIEPWLYGLSGNLMQQRRTPAKMSARYTVAQRVVEDATGRNKFPESYEVDPKHTVDFCKGR